MINPALDQHNRTEPEKWRIALYSANDLRKKYRAYLQEPDYINTSAKQREAIYEQRFGK